MIEDLGPIGPLRGYVRIRRAPRRWWQPHRITVTAEWYGDDPGSDTLEVTHPGRAATAAAAAADELEAGRRPDLAELLDDRTAW